MKVSGGLKDYDVAAVYIGRKREPNYTGLAISIQKAFKIDFSFRLINIMFQKCIGKKTLLVHLIQNQLNIVYYHRLDSSLKAFVENVARGMHFHYLGARIYDISNWTVQLVSHVLYCLCN